MHGSKEPIEIRRVESNYDLMEFIKFPWTVYEEDEHWVAPLIKQQKEFLGPENPFFAHAEAEYFLAQRGRTTCGRISASIDHNYVDTVGEKVGCFGFFESFDDYETASRLLNAAHGWLTEKGMKVMRGPFNFTLRHEWGLLVDCFDHDPALFTTHNPHYYVGLLERYGLKKARDYYSNFDVDMSFLSKLSEKAAKNGVVVRKIDLNDIREEAKRIQDLYNSAWSELWDFFPVPEGDVKDIAKKLKYILIDHLTYIGELDGKPIGFLIFLPDYNVVIKKMNGKTGPIQTIQFLWHKKRIKKGILPIAGVHKDYQRTGVAAAMVIRAYESAIHYGFESADLLLAREDNIPSRAILEMAGGKTYKTHRIYEMSLSA